jgi:hypothetical protein
MKEFVASILATLLASVMVVCPPTVSQAATASATVTVSSKPHATATATVTITSPPTTCITSSLSRPLAGGSQLYGVTFDDISNVSGELDALVNLPHAPSTRIYFDPAAAASTYVSPIKTFYPKSYIMGEVADSSDMVNFTTSSIGSRTTGLINALGPCVDVWEVGNEINGDWLLNNANSAAATMSKMEAVYDAVTNPADPTSRSKLTALTFFYEGEPSDKNNCIATANGGNDMFTWIKTNFQTTPTSETEKIRNGLNYVLISWYPAQCNNMTPSWPAIYEKLAAIFPNAYLGFGELGTANPDYGQPDEIALVNTFYPMVRNGIVWPGTAAQIAYMKAHYIGGYFWWYAAQEIVPRASSVLYPYLFNAMK